ncbi:MAG: hypothetical protein ACHQTE_00660 [Candidatus Saccharimonadales bacterium]
MTKKEVTTNDIMDALGQFANSVDGRFDQMDKHFFKIDKRLDNFETDVTEIKTKVNHIYNVLDDHMNSIKQFYRKMLCETCNKSVWSVGSFN